VSKETIIYLIIMATGLSIGAIALTDAQNQADYLQASDLAWNQYSEDLISSSEVLNDFVNKNITRREAMSATTAIYMLTFQATNNLNSVKPTEEYVNYHNYTVNTLTNLQWYLWYMAKFYETNNSGYAIRARENFNYTKMWREKAIEEKLLYL
jgi:hypothetical protein